MESFVDDHIGEEGNKDCFVVASGDKGQKHIVLGLIIFNEVF